MLPSAKRKKDGDEQPGIKMGMFNLRIPFVHAPFEVPEAIQALVVFVVGVSAIAYMEDIFGLPFAVALAVVCVHETLEVFYGMLGEPTISGWITPAIPLITTWILGFGTMQDKIQALVSLQIILGLFFIVFGLTGIATKLVTWVPTSIKAGILIGAGISAITGKYGFMSLDKGGAGIFKYPISWTVGILIALFLLYSSGFSKIKLDKDNGLIKLLAKAGFVPALFIAYLVGVLVGELPLPTFDLSQGIFFNPIPGLKEGFSTFSLFAFGFPPMRIILSALPVAFITYIISFGNIVVATELNTEAGEARPDEKVDVNPDRANILTGARNIIQGIFAPNVVMSGPLWTAMQVTTVERYKQGKKSMYSLFGGVISFDLAKMVATFTLPLVAFINPILPLGMSLTLMIQAFACFNIGFGMTKTTVQKGVAGVTGAIMSVTEPHIGLLAGVIISLVVEFLFSGGRNIQKQVDEEMEEVLEIIEEMEEQVDA